MNEAWFVLAFIALLTWRYSRKLSKERPAFRSVALLVLGDVGRSPRMMYHAESFAKNGFETFLIGYGGSTIIPSLRTQPNFRCLYLSEPPSIPLPFSITAPFKVLYQIFTILIALFVRVPHPPEFILVQNPPSIPTLALVWLVSRARGSKVIIDWHNLGYSILALKLGANHPLVKIAKSFEAYFGHSAYAHLFVTHAMREYLVKEWKLEGQGVVLHDRPPTHFHRCTPEESHELFVRLAPLLGLKDFFPEYSPPRSTPFTSVTATSPSVGRPAILDPHSMAPSARKDRPALLVSSTSWTPDEDFSILLSALSQYEKHARSRTDLPRILVAVTGKGPLREHYMKRVSDLQKDWTYVRCISLWLEAEDYPMLLGAADLGVCLHASSSALDLPMKVVDMFGCSLPVCALDFSCLGELVRDGGNGRVFRDASELAGQLETLLRFFPDASALAALQTSLTKSLDTWGTWEENWNHIMRPLVLPGAGDWARRS